MSRYGNAEASLSGYDYFAITPGASALQKEVRGLWVGGAGNVTITSPAGSTVEFAGVPAGTMLPLRATHVTAATTATSIVGVY